MKRILYLGAMFLGLAMAGCSKKGGGEKVGEKLDNTNNPIEDALTPDGAGEKAGKKIDRTVDRVNGDD